MRRPLALTLIVLLVAPAAAQAKPLLGIADNKASVFNDTRLQDLHLRYSRINIPWDVLQDRNTLPSVDSWMGQAKFKKYTPLISFDRSRRSGRQSKNPTNAQIAATLKTWRRRWGGTLVHTISAWNEPNINKQPKLVAGWYRALRHACPTCTVLPGELVDRGNAVSYAKRVAKLAKRTPAIWGLHSYIDANTFSTKRIRAFAKAIPGQIWLTETMGVVSRKNTTVRFKGTGVAFQTKATRFLLSDIARSTPRLRRIYLYSWSAGAGLLTFDSGLVDPAGVLARPALNVVRSYLGLPPDPFAFSAT